jgi:hypothetical protein
MLPRKRRLAQMCGRRNYWSELLERIRDSYSLEKYRLAEWEHNLIIQNILPN